MKLAKKINRNNNIDLLHIVMILRSAIIAILVIIVLFIGIYMVMGNRMGSNASLSGVAFIILSLIIFSTETHYLYNGESNIKL